MEIRAHFIGWMMLSQILMVGIPAQATWLCEEAASLRTGQVMTVCGIGESVDEDKARKTALENAFSELEMICERSADCRGFELLVEPMRNECRRSGEKFKCHRAIHVEITTRQKAKTPSEDNPASQLSRKEKEQEGKVTARKCDYDTQATLTFFEDLSSESRINDAVRAAMKIPFRLACSDFHFRVMGILKREGVRSDLYEDFLLTTVQTSTDAKELENAIEIIAYLPAREVFKPRTWEAARDTFVRAPKVLLHRLSSFLFQPHAKAKESQALQGERLSELMRLAQERKIGRPVPLDFDSAFIEIARGLLEEPNHAHPWLALQLFENYFDKLSFTQPEELSFFLNKLYNSLADEPGRQKVIQWLATSFSRAPASAIPYRSLMAFIDERAKARSEDQEKAAATKKLYLQLNAKRMDEVFALLKQRHEIDAARQFCLANDVPCASLVPRPDDLRAHLMGEDAQKRALALVILKNRPEIAHELEGQIFAALNREVEKGGRFNVISSAIEALANAKIGDAAKIRRILGLCLERRCNAEGVASKLGEKAIDPLLTFINDERHGGQSEAVRCLRLLAKTSPRALSVLRDLSRRHRSDSIREVAAEALQGLEN